VAETTTAIISRWVRVSGPGPRINSDLALHLPRGERERIGGLHRAFRLARDGQAVGERLRDRVEPPEVLPLVVPALVVEHARVGHEDDRAVFEGDASTVHVDGGNEPAHLVLVVVVVVRADLGRRADLDLEAEHAEPGHRGRRVICRVVVGVDVQFELHRSQRPVDAGDFAHLRITPRQ